MIDASTASQFLDFLLPIHMALVIHAGERAESKPPLDLLIAGGSDDHPCAGSPGKLEREDRHAARALGLQGLSVTMPLKAEVAEAVDTLAGVYVLGKAATLNADFTRPTRSC